MNKRRKMLIILMNSILILFIISNTVFGTPIDIFENSINTTGSGINDIKDEGATILGVIKVVGTIVSIAMLIVLGIKYMVGSADQKAEYRKSMLPYFVGSIMIFGATNLADAIYEWIKGF